jgi:hypothetical protein
VACIDAAPEEIAAYIVILPTEHHAFLVADLSG